MGAADVETITQQNAEMTSAKPRERQFQVVPMPGVFTRGRWKCWDYREVREEAAADKKEAHDASKEKEKCENGVPGNEIGNATATVPINVPNITATNEAGMDTTSNYSTTSEMNFAVSADTVSNSESTPVKERDNRESSTILVTSIAPAPPTPQHGTPQSVSGSLEHYADSPITTMTHAQSESIISTKCAPPNIATAMDDIQNMEQNATASTQNQQQQQGQAPSVPVATSAPVQTQSTVTRQISSNESSCIADEDNDNSSTTATVATPNVAAIDNKIEQAMDLVKTHLTFAVREEVEVLRQTISELEQKVAALETENQQLRQYAPVEVVSQLSTLVQKLDSAPAPSAAGTLPMLSPPTVPAGFCSSSFATTLNNVVNSSL